MEQSERDSILIVDDKRSNIDMLEHTLKCKGFDVYTALSGKEALQCCHNHKLSLILLDIEMPEMNGYEVCRRLSQDNRFADIPVIFLSAFVDKKYRIDSFKAGGVDYIEKPFFVEEVLARVNTHISLRKSQDELKLLNRDLFQQFENTFQNAPIGIVNISPEGEFLKVNQFFCDMLGYNENELVGGHVSAVIKDDYNEVKTKVAALLRADSVTREGRVDLVSKSGQVICGKVKIERLSDSKGVLLYSIITVEDITEKIRTEQELLHNKKNMNEAQHIAKIGSWEYVFETHSFSASDELYVILGLDVKEKSLSYQNLFRYIHPNDRLVFRRDFTGFLESKTPFNKDYRLLLSDGTLKYVCARCEVEFSEKGQVVRALGTLQDNSERQILDDRLEQLALIVQKTDNSVLVTNPKGEIEWVNQAFVSMTDFHLSDVEGKLAYSVISGAMTDKAVLKKFVAAFKNKTSAHVEAVCYRKSGDWFWADLDIQPIGGNDGVLKHFLLLERDITDKKNADEILLQTNINLKKEIEERKRLEIDLTKAKEKAEQSDRLKSAFISNLSHEIRTPLNGILGFANLLSNSSLPDDKRGFYKKILTESCDNLLKIVEDILEVSRVQSGSITVKQETVSVNLLIIDLYNKYKTIVADKNLELAMHVDVDEASSIILSDRNRLSQVFTNLIDNAVKFTNSGKISIGYKLVEDYVRFYVKDTGVGIAGDMHGVVFEMFRQLELDISRQYGGTGIGLPISRKIVEYMGGRLWLESELNRGSTFYFEIPYRPIELVKEEKGISGNHSPNSSEGFSILVAEDDEINFLFMREVLNSASVVVKHARTGVEAVDMCLDGGAVDLVIMDLNMPVLDGVEAARKIKKTNPTVPIVAYTVYVGEETRDEVESAGFDGFLSKPVEPERLIEYVKYYKGIETDSYPTKK